MKANDRLYQKIAPMGVNDIMMAIQYQYVPRPPLELPIIIFNGLYDATIERGAMKQWSQYTMKQFTHINIEGDHYFVSTKYKEVLNLSPLHDHVCMFRRRRLLWRDEHHVELYQLLEGLLTYNYNASERACVGPQKTY